MFAPEEDVVHYSRYGARYCYAGTGAPGAETTSPLLWFVTCPGCLSDLAADLQEAQRRALAKHVGPSVLHTALSQALAIATTEEELEALVKRAEHILLSNLFPQVSRLADTLRLKLRDAVAAGGGRR